jgi:hypothetical protein
VKWFSLLVFAELGTIKLKNNFVLKRTVAWKTTIDISLLHISVKWAMLPYELQFWPHKLGTDE